VLSVIDAQTGLAQQLQSRFPAPAESVTVPCVRRSLVIHQLHRTDQFWI